LQTAKEIHAAVEILIDTKKISSYLQTAETI